MSNSWGVRGWLTAAGLGVAIAVSGCSSPDGGAQPTAAASVKPGSEGAASATSAPAPGERLSSPGATSPQSGKPVLTRVDKKTISKIKVQTAGAETKRRFASLVSSIGGLATQVEYYRASVGSTSSADIAVFSFAQAQAKSAIFQGQIVSQLVTGASGSAKTRFDTVGGRKFTVASKTATAVGSFDGNSAVLVLGAPGRKGLDLASGAAIAYYRR